MENAASQDFFQPIGNTKPWLKIAYEGEPGTGKSWTAALTAIGLHKKINSKKPVVVFDTEKASKFLIPLFKEHGIAAMVKESHSLADLKKTMDLCADGYADIVIIDSISHVWMDFQEAYKRKLNRKTFQIQDWMTIKADWNANFSIPLVQLPIHILATGRVSDRMEEQVDEDTGRKEFTKTGVKMQAEKNAAYEFDMLVLMERHELINKRKREVWRQATILKGRGNLLDGAMFKNPTYADFESAINAILLDPENRKQTETDAGELIETESNKREYLKRRDIMLEKIEAALTKVWPGSGKEEKTNKIEALEFAFGTPSWTEIQGMNPDRLESDFVKIHEFVQTKTTSL